MLVDDDLWPFGVNPAPVQEPPAAPSITYLQRVRPHSFGSRPGFLIQVYRDALTPAQCKVFETRIHPGRAEAGYDFREAGDHEPDDR